jgi:hypothetical protein
MRMKRLLGFGVYGILGLSLACAGDGGTDGVVPDGNADALTGADCEAEPLYEDEAALLSWMTVDSDYVYWVEDRANSLSRQPKHGGSREDVTGGVGAGWANLASDGEHLYFGGSDQQIRRVSSRDHENISLSSTGGEIAGAVQVDGPYVYWRSSSGDAGRSDFSAQARRVRTDGTQSAELLWSAPSGTFSSGLAIGGGYFFVDVYDWSYPAELTTSGQILRVAVTGGPAEAIATDLLVPRVHGADERYVYFSAQDADRYTELWRVATDGGAPELMQSGSVELSVDVGQMLIDRDTVWWGQANRGTLHRATAGVGSSTLAVDAQHILGLAADGDFVYFSSSYSGDDIGPAAIRRIGRRCLVE